MQGEKLKQAHFDETEIIDKLGIDPENVDSVTTDVDGTPIVNLNDKGQKEIYNQINDITYEYLEKFVQATRCNKDKVSEDFYNLIDRMGRLIEKYKAPWYLPLYHALKNPIILLVYYNTHADEYKDCYECILKALGDVLSTIIDKFEEMKEKDAKSEEYKTYPVIFAVQNILNEVQNACNCDINLYEKYNEYVEKLKEEKAKAESDAIRYAVLVSELLKKSKNKKSKYRGLLNKLLIAANPSKYRLKQPKTLELNEMMDVCRKLYEKYGPIENLIIQFKIPEEIVKVFELSDEELEKIHDKNIREKLLKEVEALKELARQVEELTNGQVSVRDIIEGKDISEEDLKQVTDLVKEAVDNGAVDDLTKEETSNDETK